jgi:hypothetical protein
MKDRKKYRQSLITKLLTLSVEGPSRGGPYVGIQHNDVTRSIVAEGEEIVPLLLNKLETSNLTETIYIVFCLRELHAQSAKKQIQQLQRSDRFKDIEKDMTLEMQIKYFLRDVDSW